MPLVALGFLSLYSIDTSASVSLESKEISAEINSNSTALQSKHFGDLLISIKKTEKYEKIINVEIEITNISNSIIELSPIKIITGDNIRKSTNEGGGYGASFYEFIDPFVINGDAEYVKKMDADFLTEHTNLPLSHWFGWTDRYNVEAIRFTSTQHNWHHKITHESSKDLSPKSLFIQLENIQGNIQPGELISIQFDYLSSPKLRSVLNNENIGLEKLLLIDLWNWFRALCFAIWRVLDFLFSMTGSWGISIILLALVIRLITIPVTRISLRYQEKAIQQQHKFAPLIKDIKQKYNGVEESEQIIKLYENQDYDHLAPFKSMIGLFVQIPIFIALFQIIGNSWELNGQSFLWISNLAISDRLLDWGVNIPYFGHYLNLLPIIMAIVTFLSTWLAAKHSGNKNTSTMTLFGMGTLFFVLFYSFPAALVLYWTSSNIIQLLQQSVENSIKTNI